MCIPVYNIVLKDKECSWKILDLNDTFCFLFFTRDLTNCYIFQVTVACCSVDILKQLSAEEISRNPEGGSKQRMATLANHLLNQQRHVFNYKTIHFFGFSQALVLYALNH